MEIIYLEETTSTHNVLVERLRRGEIQAPVALIAEHQVAGVGSRNNHWQGGEGNLFLSFCQEIASLPNDLPKHSMSIYYSFVMKEVLEALGSQLFLKWPNDFYIDDKKIGGTITKVISDKIVVCSMGINLKVAPENFATIDIDVDISSLIKSFILKLKEEKSWKHVFRKYQVEFSKSQRFLYYDEIQKKKVSLKNAQLLKDGSIEFDGRKVYSLR